MFKLVFYVPVSEVEQVKSAVLAQGAGKLGAYDHCCWQVLGQGQFRPLDGSNPTIGEVHQLCSLNEYRVEMLCADDCIQAAVAALKSAHPYEEPAYDVWHLEMF